MPEQEGIAKIGVYGISIGVAIIIVVFMTIFLTTLRDMDNIVTDSIATRADNQSFTWPGNNTLVAFEHERISNLLVYGNDSLMTENINYSVETLGVRILNQTATASVNSFNTLVYNMSYDYSYGSSARNSTQLGIDGQTTFASFFPLIALALIASLVVGIVLRFFNMRQQ